MTAPARLDSDPRIRLSHFHRYAIACAAVLAAAMLLNLLWLGLFGYDFTLGVPTLWQRAVPVRSDINLDHYPLVLLLLAIIPALDQPRWRNAAALGCVYGLVVQGGYLLAHMGTLKAVSSDWLMADWAWGGLLGTLATTAAWWVRHRQLHGRQRVVYRAVGRM
ncbi:hypothetical protein JCM19000A_22630 [Silvimonas sp. JCM 19000]